jgi:hypothetical protein
MSNGFGVMSSEQKIKTENSELRTNYSELEFKRGTSSYSH